MTSKAQIIDGKQLAEEFLGELRDQVSHLTKLGVTPSLAVVQVGQNPASQIYVRMKTRKAEELGITSETVLLPADTSSSDLLQVVERLNQDESVHGILVQLPLPEQIEERSIIEALDPDKDVDGFHPRNRGRLMAGEDTFVPCTPLGVQKMLIRSGFDPAGKHVVIVGRSLIVGKPLAILLTQKGRGANATVTLCHTGTRNLDVFTRQADILIAAAGKPKMIAGNMLNPDAVVIDVGVNRIPDPTSEKGYRLVGDVDFESAKTRVKAISPVPGGVGPMTIAMLMHNTVKAAKNQMRQ